MRVRGLKYFTQLILSRLNWSHPMRVRGLKFPSAFLLPDIRLVAPHAGAWIEIGPICSPYLPNVSHPMRVRGLK